MFQKKINVMGVANDNEFEFQKKFTLAERQLKYQNVINAVGEQKALVVVEKHKKSNIQSNTQVQQPWKIFAIDKTKNLAEFLHCIKLNAAINKQTSIFLYCNNTLLMLRGMLQLYLDDQTVGQIFDSQKNKEDNILYIKYSDFETFGF
ncbi:unnamed protein product (macronuclear) [Paramecium tetraurelia]|uniref:Autophagy-related protein n=1 Tax=Paramecium tetraurelia TaxID=5888 RepID=A0DDT4_PARTE|nr:uncharacterized protein GSPATT00016042001 [Paramecium tetraurelia]CAK81201.1 unnamed protein product [Paramecium tetraurelia]|eukprot:XP_001448598.1 hypothetical protein (macronuclear) [Paramecium tetraurelia strain d4-2]